MRPGCESSLARSDPRSQQKREREAATVAERASLTSPSASP